MIGHVLSAVGARGPVLLVASLTLGLLFPSLAGWGYRLLPLSAFLLTFGSLLTAGLSKAEAQLPYGLVALALVWIGAALPAAGAMALALTSLDPALRAGFMLSLLAPPVGSAAAIATMVGLQPRLALVVSLGLTLLAPLSMPALTALFGLGLQLNVAALAWRLSLIVGAAAALAGLSLLYRERMAFVFPDQRAATGVAVVGLIVVGLATSQSFHSEWAEHAARFGTMLAAATAVNFGLCGISALVFSGVGLRPAGTMGLVSGNRNVTLAWAAAGLSLPQAAETYVAACVVPVLALPLILRGFFVLRRVAAAAHAAQRGGDMIAQPLGRVDPERARPPEPTKVGEAPGPTVETESQNAGWRPLLNEIEDGQGRYDVYFCSTTANEDEA